MVWEYIITEYGWQTIVPAAVMLMTLVGTFWYFWGDFNAVVRHRHNRKNKPAEAPAPLPVSVVLVVKDDLYFIENGLRRVLEQNYPDFEVIVVHDTPENEASVFALEQLAQEYPHLYVTRIRKDPVFNHTYKLALTVGIKAARSNQILIVQSGYVPVSENWLQYMSRGFATGQQKVVIGFCSVEAASGFCNRYIRTSNLYHSLLLLGRAVKGKAYKADVSNYGFTAELFYAGKGFNEHLRMHSGCNDVFIRKIATRTNTSVILKDQAKMLCPQYGSMRWWRHKRKYDTYMQRYYPVSVKTYLTMDPLFRLFFWISALVLVLLRPDSMQVWIFAGALILLRWLTVLTVFSKAAKRLGEKGLFVTFVLYDIVSPLAELRLAVSRRFRPSKDLWIQ